MTEKVIKFSYVEPAGNGPKMSGYYRPKRESWDEQKCRKLSRRLATDGLGTPYPFRGYIYESEVHPTTRYNGGTIINGKLYKGRQRLLPKLAKGFLFVNMISWGLRIIETSKEPQLVSDLMEELG